MTAVEFNFQVSQLQNHLGSFAKSLTRDLHDAQDLTQETILKAFKYKEKYKDSTNLKSWMFTIMKNTFINDYRRKQKFSGSLSAEAENYLLNSKTDPNDHPITTINTQEIKSAIESLDNECRQPFKMHFEGYKYKEISDDLNIPIGTVKSRIFLARKILMETLKEFKN